jgi:hypothetical protein
MRGGLAQLTEARDRVAQIVADGGLYALPIFERLEAELEKYTDQQSALDRARQIAEEIAARKRAA